jgi:spore coat protein I
METDKTLNSLAAKVLERYGIVPENIAVVQSGTIKTVWKIKTREGYLCLKRLKQSYDKALFSVNAQIFISKSGGNVPRVILDKRNQPIVQYDDQLFAAYEWLQGKDLNFGNPADLRIAILGLAGFHRASKGYKPPENSRVSTKLAKWPEQYNSMKNRMLAWKEAAKSRESIPSDKAFLGCVDTMVDMANQALELLDKTSYRDLTAEGSSSIVLCHQDFGPGNVISTDKGVTVLDLDGVTFDLPARDLRKIIGKLAENKNQWDKNTIKAVLEWYGSVNPMSQKEKEILYVDLLFPHWFFGLLKNQFDNNKRLKPVEIERIAKLEKAKVSLLVDLLKRGE